jgi:hypothetical protein
MPVETGDRQRPPAVIDLPQTGVYVGSNDQPAPAVTHRDLLEDTSGGARHLPVRRCRTARVNLVHRALPLQRTDGLGQAEREEVGRYRKRCD